MPPRPSAPALCVLVGILAGGRANGGGMADLRSGLAIREKGKRIGLISPYPHPCKDLRDTADFVKAIRVSVLQASQFPDVIQDAKGVFHKPHRW